MVSIEDTDPAWYKTAWQHTDNEVPWSQWTTEDVDFISKCAAITSPARILDLACGTGRHSLELARRGHSVVAVDLEEKLLAVGRAEASRAGLAVNFIHADVRDLSFDSRFDIVLNIWEGAIGYLENDRENERHFEVIARALVAGGHHIAGPLYNADWVARSAPLQFWRMSETVALLTRIDWLSGRRQIVDTCTEFRRDEDLRWRMKVSQPVCYRIYTPAELVGLLARVNLRLVDLYPEPARQPAPVEQSMEYWVHSVKGPRCDLP